MKSFRHLLTFISGICLVTVAVFGPLAFGSVEPWAYAILAALAFTALAATLMHDVVAGRAGAAFSPLTAIGCAALVIVALQLIPMPAGLIEALLPEALYIPVSVAAALGEPMPEWIVPSLYPHATRVSLIKLGAYIALFAAACSYISSRRRLNRIAAAIVASGFVASLVGILQNLSGTRDIFWLRQIRSGALFGPFVSRNQFAAYAGICMFTGIGLLLAKGGYAPAFIRKRSKRRRMPPARPAQNILLGFVVAVMGAAIIWSLSRGGIISAFLAGAAVLAAMITARYFSGGKVYLFAALLLTLGFVTWFGWTPVVKQLSSLGVIVEDPVSADRFRYAMWNDAWRMGLDFPVLGTGAGAYLSVSPTYRSFPGEMVARNPHNEYLAVLAETGFIGLILLLMALGFLLTRVFKALR